jgi:hypothetical protein
MVLMHGNDLLLRLCVNFFIRGDYSRCGSFLGSLKRIFSIEFDLEEIGALQSHDQSCRALSKKAALLEAEFHRRN